MEKPPKRLRGWKLEKVKASPSSEKHPCQKDVDDSPLVTRLLELWSQGRISASQAAEIAHLASLEGANSQESFENSQVWKLPTISRQQPQRYDATLPEGLATL